MAQLGEHLSSKTPVLPPKKKKVSWRARTILVLSPMNYHNIEYNTSQCEISIAPEPGADSNDF
jgi:hypothetical protein